MLARESFPPLDEEFYPSSLRMTRCCLFSVPPPQAQKQDSELDPIGNLSACSRHLWSQSYPGFSIFAFPILQQREDTTSLLYLWNSKHLKFAKISRNMNKLLKLQLQTLTMHCHLRTREALPEDLELN
ncbi:hypothetical protein F0562_024981 [Nyssa sinensis]|uniref:Uncharacterized protein n=1 Tax=Nyssa sinensis TaxID=561372 RepID=A0A5J5BID8_9ASTE|nr:hypothetical protein F0562_024981 [Nyssa sinensis]